MRPHGLKVLLCLLSKNILDILILGHFRNIAEILFVLVESLIKLRFQTFSNQGSRNNFGRAETISWFTRLRLQEHTKLAHQFLRGDIKRNDGLLWMELTHIMLFSILQDLISEI